MCIIVHSQTYFLYSWHDYQLTRCPYLISWIFMNGYYQYCKRFPHPCHCVSIPNPSLSLLTLCSLLLKTSFNAPFIIIILGSFLIIPGYPENLSNYSGIFPDSFFTYYAQNYASIIDTCLIGGIGEFRFLDYLEERSLVNGLIIGSGCIVRFNKFWGLCDLSNLLAPMFSACDDWIRTWAKVTLIDINQTCIYSNNQISLALKLDNTFSSNMLTYKMVDVTYKMEDVWLVTLTK